MVAILKCGCPATWGGVRPATLIPNCCVSCCAPFGPANVQGLHSACTLYANAASFNKREDNTCVSWTLTARVKDVVLVPPSCGMLREFESPCRLLRTCVTVIVFFSLIW